MTDQEHARTSAKLVRQNWEGRVDHRELARLEQDAYEFFLRERTLLHLEEQVEVSAEET